MPLKLRIADFGFRIKIVLVPRNVIAIEPIKNFIGIKPVMIVFGLEDNSMTREFNVVIERDADGYFIASVPSLRGCHTQAKSLDVLMERIREAIELCLEVEEPTITDFVGVQRVVVTK